MPAPPEAPPSQRARLVDRLCLELCTDPISKIVMRGVQHKTRAAKQNRFCSALVCPRFEFGAAYRSPGQRTVLSGSMRWLLALAVLTKALVPPHRPRPVRTRVYKLPQETVDLKFRAKGLLDDVKRNLEEGAEMPDSAEKLRKAYVTDVSSRRPSASSACVHRVVAARRRCLRTSAPMASRWHRLDAVDATRPQRIEREHSPMCATQQTSSPRRRPT